MATPIPPHPNLEQLRKQAKDLVKAHRRGEAESCAVLKHLGRLSRSSPSEILKATISLQEAQHALAPLIFGLEGLLQVGGELLLEGHGCLQTADTRRGAGRLAYFRDLRRLAASFFFRLTLGFS